MCGAPRPPFLLPLHPSPPLLSGVLSITHELGAERDAASSVGGARGSSGFVSFLMLPDEPEDGEGASGTVGVGASGGVGASAGVDASSVGGRAGGPRRKQQRMGEEDGEGAAAAHNDGEGGGLGEAMMQEAGGRGEDLGYG